MNHSNKNSSVNCAVLPLVGNFVDYVLLSNKIISAGGYVIFKSDLLWNVLLVVIPEMGSGIHNFLKI